MSYHVCSECGHISHVFGRDGATKLTTEMDLELLGKHTHTHSLPPDLVYYLSGDIPLHEDIMKSADRGCPIVISQPHSILTTAYINIASRLIDLLPWQQDHPS